MARTRTRWMVAASLSLLSTTTIAQSILPTNWTAADTAQHDDDRVLMQISLDDHMVPLAQVLSLTDDGVNDIPPTGLSGPVLLATPSNTLDIQSKDVAFISCDPYTGELQAADVFFSASQANVTAVVFYSQWSDWCQLQNYTGSYKWIYTLKNRTDSERLLQETDDSSSQAVYAKIGPSSQRNANGTLGSGHGNGNGSTSHRAPQNAPPTTAVAMVILYSITGVITALFLCIIITGALRAHRHPERYGPRLVVRNGRPRQSRARGLAIAMLETLPIVKFGEQREEPKPTDVELGEQGHADSTHEQPTTTTTSIPSPTSPTTTTPPLESRRSIEQGISAAISANNNPSTPDSDPNHLGCSICTEDFVAGEDQRVLPCDHRFHPACVDPWLLNVSGTCPLCRIDLRPQETVAEEGEAGEGVVSEERGADGVVVYAVQQRQGRMGMRRSLVEGFRGLTRPVPREAQGQAQEGGAAAGAETAGVEGVVQEEQRRRRLSRLFGVRTRTTPRTMSNTTQIGEDTTMREADRRDGEDEARR